MEFEQLVKKISPTLKRITYRLNGHFTCFNDEDLFQEALIHLWQDFRAGALSDKTDSYILQGCYFHLKNYIRKHRPKVKALSIDEAAGDEGAGLKETAWLQDKASNNYFEELNCRMLAEKIRNNGLSQKEKKVLFLCAEGLTTREIGARSGVSHVRVVKMMSAIRQKCRKYREI